MKEILIFKFNKIAYDSTVVFADVLGKNLSMLGAKVEFFDASSNSIIDLEQLSKRHFDAIIDFNSKLPDLVVDDGSFFLDCFDAPFFNYILDHPVYHHKNLCKKIKNYNVICVDNEHCEYIKRYYPHIKSTFAMPLGAIKFNGLDKIDKQKGNVVQSFSEQKLVEYNNCSEWIRSKEYDLIFAGSYLNPDDYYEIIDNMPKELKNDIFDIADLLINDSKINYEHAVLNVKGNDILENENAPVIMQMYFLADIFARACIRKKVLFEIVKSHIPIMLFGENFDKSGLDDYSNVRLMGQMPYWKSLGMFSRSKYVLNIMPLFKSGIHDRVLNAMINNSVSISDSNGYMDSLFDNGKDYIRFDIAECEKIPYIINDLYTNDEKAFNIMLSASKKINEYTFLRHADKIINSNFPHQ